MYSAVTFHCTVDLVIGLMSVIIIDHKTVYQYFLVLFQLLHVLHKEIDKDKIG